MVDKRLEPIFARSASAVTAVASEPGAPETVAAVCVSWLGAESKERYGRLPLLLGEACAFLASLVRDESSSSVSAFLFRFAGLLWLMICVTKLGELFWK